MADVLARFLLRSGTSTLWASVNPILASGEPGFETDTKIMRIGDGVTAYTSLPKIVSALAVGQAILAAADANAAQTAMGGTSVGRGVFSAADAAAAQTAIGASTTGKAVLVAANQAAARTAIGAVIGTDVQAYDVNTLKANVASTITAAVIGTPEDAGTKSSGTYTPSPVNGNFKKYINGGAHTLAAPVLAGSYSMVIQVTNNASAGAITFSGFAKVIGDVLTTTNGHLFQICITKSDGGVVASVVAMQ